MLLCMIKLLLIGLLLIQPASGTTARIRNRALPVADVGAVTYGISVPNNYNAGNPRPLVLALHPGGPRVAYYGSRFIEQVVLPGLGDLQAIVVAPDCPARSWSDPVADRAVVELLEQVRQDYAIDGQRILVTGFSMGGGGAWFMSSEHPDLYTGAIAIAAPVGDIPVERLGIIPTYVIHSRDDRVVPFGPAEQTATQLSTLGRVVKFDSLSGPGHGDMSEYVSALRRGVEWVVEQWDAQ